MKRSLLTAVVVFCCDLAWWERRSSSLLGRPLKHPDDTSPEKKKNIIEDNTMIAIWLDDHRSLSPILIIHLCVGVTLWGHSVGVIFYSITLWRLCCGGYCWAYSVGPLSKSCSDQSLSCGMIACTLGPFRRRGSSINYRSWSAIRLLLLSIGVDSTFWTIISSENIQLNESFDFLQTLLSLMHVRDFVGKEEEVVADLDSINEALEGHLMRSLDLPSIPQTERHLIPTQQQTMSFLQIGRICMWKNNLHLTGYKQLGDDNRSNGRTQQQGSHLRTQHLRNHQNIQWGA